MHEPLAAFIQHGQALAKERGLDWEFELDDEGKTDPESELPLPSSLALNGERSWHWIELPLHISYFIATVKIVDGDLTIRKTLLYSDIRSVLQVARDTNDNLILERVDVLIPEYLHQDDGYKLAQIKEVWMSDEVTSFVLADGSKVYDSLSYGIDEQENMHLVASF